MHRQGQTARGPQISWQGRVREWFRRTKRPLPWRNNPTPYRVWVSEVMLQQTQVATVLPYFHRWMERFPTIQSLAEAPLEAVIKCWEGLGYYSRARFLHQGARQVVHEFEGELPDTQETLSQIKGLGPYTVGALLSFAFHQKAAAVDGNVIRVLTRFFAVGDDVTKPAVVQKLRQLMHGLLPDAAPWEVMEGIIELGATVCTRRAKCEQCPISADCKAFETGRPAAYPYKSQSVSVTQLERSVAVVESDGSLLVKRGAPGKVMADLYEFPYVPLTGEPQQAFEELLGIPLTFRQTLPKVRHTFTRYRAKLHPEVYSAPGHEVKGYEWVGKERLNSLPFSSGYKRVLKHYTSSS